MSRAPAGLAMHLFVIFALLFAGSAIAAESPCPREGDAIFPTAASLPADIRSNLATRLRPPPPPAVGPGQTDVLADPGGRWNPTDATVNQGPMHRMSLAFQRGDAVYVYYEGGGIAHSARLAIYHRAGLLAWRLDSDATQAACPDGGRSGSNRRGQ